VGDPHVWLQRIILGLSRHWLAWTNLTWGVFVALPWLAPVLMVAGMPGLGRAIYLGYSLVCHQRANRSFFLFGPKATYSYLDLAPFAPGADTWSGLRAFVGTPELGYKVAWSDRMVALYGGVFLAGLAFGLLRRRLRPLKWWASVLLSVPLVVDGTTHLISDLWGVGKGFRYHNAWLGTVTGHLLPSRFYVGTELGSFDSLMRLATGLLFAWAVVWLAYPLLETALRETGRTLASRLEMVAHDAIERP
jgi:uncharacterized membrane protein